MYLLVDLYVYIHNPAMHHAPATARALSVCTLINPRRMRSEGYSSRSVFVCLFVCLSATILALQATRRLMRDTNSFSATRARK